MGWEDRLADTAASPVFYVAIEGIPYVFTSAPDWGWSAPECARHTSDIPAYTVLNDVLQVDQGIKMGSWSLNEKMGIIDPGGMTLRLTDNRDQLLSLFSPRLASADRTNLTETLGWDAAGTGEDRYSVTVESTGDFSAPDTLYIGRETIYYDTIANATTFGDAPEDATDLWRGCYAWRWDGADDWDSWHLDYRHWFDSGNEFVAEEVANHPRTWKGRRVVLCMNWLREQGGTPFDSDWRGDHEVEIYGGLIQDDPQPVGESGHEWQIRLEPLTRALDTQIGANAADAVVGFPHAGVAWVYVPAQAKPIVELNAYISFQSGAESEKENETCFLKDSSNNLIDDTVIPWYKFVEYMAWGVYYKLYEAGGGLWAQWPIPGQHTGGYSTAVNQDEPHLHWKIEWDEPSTNYRCRVQWKITTVLAHTHRTSFPTWGLDHAAHGHSEWWTDDVSVSEIVPPDLSNRIPISLSDTARAFERDFDATNGGYCVIGTTGECAKYDSVITTGMPPGYGLLEIPDGGRGLLGTTMLSAESMPYSMGGALGGEVIITDALGIDRHPIWEIFLSLMVSTGEDGHRDSQYDDDAYGRHWGAKIDPSMIDKHSFQQMALDEGYLSWRRMALAKPQNLRKWVESECAWAQSIVTQRTCEDGRIRIGVYRMQDAAKSEAIDNSISTLRAERQPAKSTPINAVSIATMWHAGQAKFLGPDVHIRHVESINDHQREYTQKFEIAGLFWPWQSLNDGALDVAKRVFARWLEPGVLLTLYTTLDAMLFKPGQTVGITVPNIPTDEGARGYSARPATILGIEPVPYAPNQDWQAKVHVRIEPHQAISTYCPCGKVASYAAGVPSITLTANEFSDPEDVNPWNESPTTDAVWFQDGFSIIVWNEGDWANRESHDIVSRSGNVLTIDGVLVLVPDATTRITYDVYDDGDTQATQKLFVYIGDTGSPSSLGAASDKAFRYS
jgi:hypothetical protein